MEEERDYLKAKVEYLKKQYPNLHGEGGFQNKIDLRLSMS
jgi:transposase